MTTKRKRIKPNRLWNSICPLVMIGDYPIVMKSVVVRVRSKMNMLSINFINTKRKLKMKKIATLIATLVTTPAFATEPAKTPAAPAAPAVTASAPAAPAKEEMKLAKKKEDKKADATKSAKPAKPTQDKKATAKTEPATPAAPAVPATK